MLVAFQVVSCSEARIVREAHQIGTKMQTPKAQLLLRGDYGDLGYLIIQCVIIVPQHFPLLKRLAYNGRHRHMPTERYLCLEVKRMVLKRIDRRQHWD